MKKFLLLVILVITTFTAAEDINNTPPDYLKIESEIKNPNSPYFYPKLFARLKAFDENFTIEEFRYLYYGYTFQDSYAPYKISHYSSKAAELLRTIPTQENISEFETVANALLKEDPFNTDALRLLSRMYTFKGDDKSSKKAAKIYQDTMVTILSTGNGISCDTAFHVQNISHEYLILRIMRFNIKAQMLIKECDFLEFDDNYPKPSINGKQMDGVFFNISRLRDTFLGQLKKSYNE